MSVLFYLAEQTRHERVFASVAASAQRPTDGFSCGCGPVKALGTMHSEPRASPAHPPAHPPAWRLGPLESQIQRSRVLRTGVSNHIRTSSFME